MKLDSLFVCCGVVLSFAVVACSSDTGGGTPVDAGTTDGGGDSGGNDSAVDGGQDAAAATLDCASYCTEVMANCTGANAQYTSLATCTAVCASFPVGTLADKTGDTLGCRLYHGGAPALSSATTHCPHAGPTGGDNNVTDVTPGTCGEGCEAFCNLAAVACTGTNSQYASTNLCLADCKTFKTSANYSTADTGNNDFGCRMYHLSAAAESPSTALTHCPHIKGASPTCIQ